jgi:hypothetical protein
MLSGRASLGSVVVGAVFSLKESKRIELETTTASHWDKAAKTKI